jgi:hypothetical protein
MEKRKGKEMKKKRKESENLTVFQGLGLDRPPIRSHCETLNFDVSTHLAINLG